MKRKLYKYLGVGFIGIIVISVIGGFILEKVGYEAEDVEEPVAAEEPIATEQQTKAVSVETTDISPLTKDEVLAKFALDPDIKPYLDAPFTFVGNREDTADYYSLADTDRYRNASVIFKDGELARVKLIPEGDSNPSELFAEFGITEEPRKISGNTGFYEVALIPLYWSQNIERYPFELD